MSILMGPHRGREDNRYKKTQVLGFAQSLPDVALRRIWTEEIILWVDFGRPDDALQLPHFFGVDIFCGDVAFMIDITGIKYFGSQSFIFGSSQELFFSNRTASTPGNGITKGGVLAFYRHLLVERSTSEQNPGYTGQ
jgi:hypothetical protein